MVARLVSILMGDIQTDVIQTVNLHLLIDGTSHDVARSQRQALVVFLHKRLAIRQFQYGTIATHSLRDKVGRMRLVGVMQDGRMELYELHISHSTLGTINHGDTVARSNDGVRGGQIDRAATTCTHDGNLRQIGVDLLRLGVHGYSVNGASHGHPSGAG